MAPRRQRSQGTEGQQRHVADPHVSFAGDGALRVRARHGVSSMMPTRLWEPQQTLKSSDLLVPGSC